jgi:hypothetical protein
MARAPEFIVFTGADDAVSVAGMAALAADYPVEWGILFDPARQGSDPRYPDTPAQSRFATSGLRLAAHLCGRHSQAIIDGRSPAADLHVNLARFRRIQVNHRRPVPAAIAAFQHACGIRCIAQCRHAFPDDHSIDWLFDRSGGRGRAPPAWPAWPGRLVGYAGGIGPDNVADIVARIDAPGPYWIDMESKVRTADRFDLALCRRVCEAVYGPPVGAVRAAPPARI